MKFWPAILLSVLLLISPIAFAAPAMTNLIPNSGMEGLPGNRLPDHWSSIVIGIAPTFSTDGQTRHGGNSSIRITAKDVTRAYVRSQTIEVAPGEKIGASVWVKCQDVPTATGHVILIGEFAQADGTGMIVEKFDTANAKITDWQKVSGEISVPANVATMRLRIGFSYGKGTIWLDDAQVWTTMPLVARMQSLHGKLSPALAQMPITVMNRNAEHGMLTLQLILSPAPPETKPKSKPKPVTRPSTQTTTQAADEDDDEEDPAKKPVASTQAIVRAKAATTRPGAEQHSVEFVLDGQPKQIVHVPLAAQHRGEKELYLVVYRGTKPIFAAYQPVRIPNALVLEPPLPTHWVIEDGSPHFTGLVDLAISDSLRIGGKLKIDVKDQAGKIVASWASSGDLPDGPSPYSIAAPQAALGEYTVFAQFQPRRDKMIEAKQTWGVIPRKLAEVTINAAGYPVYNGHAIFPLGMFNGALWKDMQNAGYTVSHSYNSADVVASEPPDDLAAQKFLDESEKHGMHALFLIPRGYVFAHQWDAFRRRLRMFKNHPALLAWDEEEGIARGDMTPADLHKMVQIIREEDPYHPIMIGDSRDMIARVDRTNFFPAADMDMGMWWWYPFPLKKVAAGALEGDEGNSALEMVLPVFLTHRNTDKPLWVGIQSYAQKKSSRYPTPTEYRAQAYAAICAGAKGLMYYGGGVTRGLQTDPDAAHWKDLQHIDKQISTFADFWMEPTSEFPTIEPKTAPISAIIKRHDGKAILIAVNRSVIPIDATLIVPDLHGIAHVLDENRTVDMDNGKLRDHFAGLGAHVYEFDLK